MTRSGLPSPYCGEAPIPAELLVRWNLDPWVLAALILAALGWAMRRERNLRSNLLVGAGLLALALAFVSPLCALSSALFSARVFHHGLLIAAAAPLLAFGLPRSGPSLPLTAATAAHAVFVWIWHAPAPYAWALSNDLAYWLMQVCLLGSAVALWRAVRQAHGLAAAAALLATMMQMGLLGALIALAGQPLYAPHLTTTQAWGLTPLADQQLAGILMWAPLSVVYLLAALGLAARAFGRDAPAEAPA